MSNLTNTGPHTPKNYKSMQALSEETLCFSAPLYRDVSR